MARRFRDGVKLIDVDADGFADTVRSYAAGAAPATGDWHLRVELAAGGGVDLALPFDPAPAGVTVLGGSYIGSTVSPGPEGARPAITQTPYTRTGNAMTLYNPPLVTTSPTLPTHDLIDTCGVDSP